MFYRFQAPTTNKLFAGVLASSDTTDWNIILEGEWRTLATVGLAPGMLLVVTHWGDLELEARVPEQFRTFGIRDLSVADAESPSTETQALYAAWGDLRYRISSVKKLSSR
jgi:hypothetical protein